MSQDSKRVRADSLKHLPAGMVDVVVGREEGRVFFKRLQVTGSARVLFYCVCGKRNNRPIKEGKVVEVLDTEAADSTSAWVYRCNGCFSEVEVLPPY